MRFSKWYGRVVVALVAVTCSAQTVVAPVTTQEFGYFKFLLTRLAGPNATPDSVSRQEKLLVLQFGLNDAELGAIDSTRSQVRAILSQAQQAAAQITSAKGSLSAADLASLATIDSQMDQQLAAVANSILAAVRPGTAARLRAPGNVAARGFAAAFNSAIGGN